MLPFFLREMRDFDDAIELMAVMGDQAADDARSRADAGREIGNVVSFCRWRQIGRLIAFLEQDRPAGTLH